MSKSYVKNLGQKQLKNYDLKLSMGRLRYTNAQTIFFRELGLFNWLNNGQPIFYTASWN